MTGYDPTLASPASPDVRGSQPALAPTLAALLLAAGLLLLATCLLPRSSYEAPTVRVNLWGPAPSAAGAATIQRNDALVRQRGTFYGAALPPFFFGSLPGMSLLCNDAVTQLTGPRGREVYLVGTVQNDSTSAQLVRAVIQAVHPDTVMVELDYSRYVPMWLELTGAKVRTPGLLDRLRDDLFAGGNLTLGERFEMVKRRMMGVALRQFSRVAFSSGQEFAVAVTEAHAVGAALLLGDQPTDVTWQRLQEALSATDFHALLSTAPAQPTVPAEDTVSRPSSPTVMARLLRQRAVVREQLAQTKAVLPEIYGALVLERDAYMARAIARAPGQRTVAVVRMAHMDGVERSLKYRRAKC
eukprot:EG_transcript_14726